MDDLDEDGHELLGTEIYRFSPPPEYNVTGIDDVATCYSIRASKSACAGLIVYGKFHGKWCANPSLRHVVRKLLEESEHWKARALAAEAVINESLREEPT